METKDISKRNIWQNILNEKVGLLISLIGILLIILGLYLFLIHGNWEKSSVLDESKIGQFGDFIGGVVGTLFALAGVILYYAALVDQRKDFKTNQDALNLQVKALNQQIVEFQEQRKELEITRQIYEQQNRTMKIQQFESNFYSYLNVYITIKNNLNSGSEQKDFFKAKSQCEKLRKIWGKRYPYLSAMIDHSQLDGASAAIKATKDISKANEDELSEKLIEAKNEIQLLKENQSITLGNIF